MIVVVAVVVSCVFLCVFLEQCNCVLNRIVRVSDGLNTLSPGSFLISFSFWLCCCCCEVMVSLFCEFL